jgi:CheY-like chemotaxis protein
MRLDHLTPAHVRRAVRTYQELAWPVERPEKPRLGLEVIAGCDTLDELFARCDRPGGARGPTAARYTLRLGNWRYPFMKLVVQEYLVLGEYFFSVDTHDDLKVPPSMPDYEAWCELRRFNAALKLEIEGAWLKAGLPTHEDLRRLMEGLARVERGDAKGARLLVVDDERDVAQGLAAVLKARGYQVETAFDGRQVLERMERSPAPDLLVLDYALPVLDGEEVMTRLRAQERFAKLPILLATATEIDLSTLTRASGMLRKPYPAEVLFALIEDLLGQAEAEQAGLLDPKDSEEGA